MAFLAFGINHKTASVSLREKVAFDLQKIEDALISLASLSAVAEGVILSTCNRTEIYCAGSADLKAEAILSWLSDYHHVDSTELQDSVFAYDGDDAFRHVMRVAAGLDSLVLGEPQILGQLKSAYASAQSAGTLDSGLPRLFETSFSVAKQVRTDTAIGENAVSVAAAAVAMSRKLFSDLSSSTALLIGAGRTTELVARHLQQANIERIVVANRTLARAKELSSLVSGEAALLGDIPDLLVDADIVISSTASALPILGKGAVERAIKLRKHRPFFMVDIAVPRDIEPQVGDLADVFLYTVDDLSDVIDENRRSREQAAKEAEGIIEQGMQRFISEYRASNAGSALKLFREKVETLRELELQKALHALTSGAEPETVVKTLARNLSNKLAHDPTVVVRDAASEGDHELAEHMLRLFKVDSGQPNAGDEP